MYIHLPGRHYDANLFHLKAFVSVLRTKSSKFVHILFFFWAVSRRYGAASSTSPTCLCRLELYLDRLFQVYQQGFFVSAGLFRKIWVLSLPEFQVVLSVLNSGFWMQKHDLFTTTAKYTLYKLLTFYTIVFGEFEHRSNINCIAFWKPSLSL